MVDYEGIILKGMVYIVSIYGVLGIFYYLIRRWLGW
jgi:hypothetical protein